MSNENKTALLKPYVCSECGGKTYEIQAMIDHYRMQHPNKVYNDPNPIRGTVTQSTEDQSTDNHD